jgi:hypothetical protein
MALTLDQTPPELFDPNAEWTTPFLPERPVADHIPPSFFYGYSWSAALTVPQQEKPLARFLHRAGIPYFLPYLSTRDSEGRRAYPPLFPMVLFFAASPVSEPYKSTGPLNDNELIVRSSGKIQSGIHGILRTNIQLRFQNELTLLGSESAARRTAKISPPIAVGVKVEVELGNRGTWIQGIVREYTPEARGKLMVFIRLELLGSVVSMEIPRSRIRVVS